MLPYLIFGMTYAFACAVQPGPLQIFIVSRTLTDGWKRTLPAALAPLISDGPIILIVLTILRQMPNWLEPALFLGGGMFLLFLGWRSFQSWRQPDAEIPDDHAPATDTIWKAALVNLLNPNPWLGWSLVMGPLFLEGWRITPAHGLALILSFYLVMVLATGGLIVLVGFTGRLNPKLSRGLVGVSAIALGLFGVYALGRGFQLIF